jgi:hypothetical protein
MRIGWKAVHTTVADFSSVFCHCYGCRFVLILCVVRWALDQILASEQEEGGVQTRICVCCRLWIIFRWKAVRVAESYKCIYPLRPELSTGAGTKFWSEVGEELRALPFWRSDQSTVQVPTFFRSGWRAVPDMCTFHIFGDLHMLGIEPSAGAAAGSRHTCYLRAMNRVGQNIYSTFGRGFIKYTAMYGVYI